MPKRALQFSQGNYYHVFNRGFNKQSIFNDESNYIHLLKLGQKYFNKYQIAVIAYCLMPNHYHFLLHQETEKSIGNAIRDIFNAYVQGLNKQTDRKGPLFEGRFKAIQIENESYLIHLCRYIHRNPIDCLPPLVENLSDWPYSNFPEWVDRRKGSLVDCEFVKTYFESDVDYQAFVHEMPSLKVLQRMENYQFD